MYLAGIRSGLGLVGFGWLWQVMSVFAFRERRKGWLVLAFSASLVFSFPCASGSLIYFVECYGSANFNSFVFK